MSEISWRAGPDNAADPIEDSYPISAMQEGMLFHSLQSKHDGLYVEQLIIRLPEEIDGPKFRRSWQEVISRLPVLRTSFHLADAAAPRQYVHRQAALPFVEMDWRHLSPAQQEQQLLSYLETDRQHGFDIALPPLLRVALIRLNDADFYCIWTFHHALLDGRSLVLVLKELFFFYEAFIKDQTVLTPSPRPYRDFIERRQLSVDASRDYWRDLLRGFQTPTSLPLAKAYPKEGFGEHTTHLSPELTQRLQAIADLEDLSLNILLQGAWALLINRHTGQEDIVFGATRAGRHALPESMEAMVGLFINTLPIRVQLASTKPVRRLFRELRKQSMAARPYEQTSLVEIQTWTDIPLDIPLFESILIFENFQLNDLLRSQGGRWQKREFRLIERTNYPLTIAAYGGQEILLSMAYKKSHYDDESVCRIMSLFQNILEDIAVGGAGLTVGDVQVLSAAEKQQILVDWNATAAAYPSASTVHQLFEEQVVDSPDATALIFAGQSWTYQDLNMRANQLAHDLRRRGVGPEAIVAVICDRSASLVLGLLATLKAGGAYVTLDPANPKDRLAVTLRELAAPVLLTEEHLKESLPDHQAQAIYLDAYEPATMQGIENDLPGTADAANLAYVVYTSGSTGRPKGVQISHEALINHNIAVIKEYELGARDRVLQFASPAFDVAIEEIFSTLLSGATLIIPPREVLSSVSRFTEFVREEKITVLNLPASYWRLLVSETAAAELDRLTSLRLIVLGSEVVRWEDVTAWPKLGSTSIGWRNAYGLSETTITSLIFKTDSEKSSWRKKSVPIGRPIANTRAYILDQGQRPVPVGVPGELYIGGDGLARGYLRLPVSTAESFMPDPFSSRPGARLFRTGDLARYLPDGQIEFLGRQDHQVKIRGFRVELAEIATILAQHPAVREAIVTYDEVLSGQKRLVGHVIQKPPSSELKIADLRRFAGRYLPDYMVPAEFSFHDAFPLTSSGKVDYRALSRSSSNKTMAQAPFTAPRDALEEAVAALMMDTLHLERVSIHDDFFSLGGHSLLAMRLLARLEDIFKVELALARFFQQPTVSGLAQEVRSSSGNQEHVFRVAQILTQLLTMPQEDAIANLEERSGMASRQSEDEQQPR